MTKIRWAARVPMEWLQQLYELDAAGIVDEELIDKVGYRLYERCVDCLLVANAASGRRFDCVICRGQLDVRGEGECRSLRCSSCGWTSDWVTFHRTWQHTELCAIGMTAFLEEFIADWVGAVEPRHKMLAIDRVIHRWHWEHVLAERKTVGRPGASNLIEGSRKQVLAFLDRLTSGPTHERWAQLHESVERLGEKTR